MLQPSAARIADVFGRVELVIVSVFFYVLGTIVEATAQNVQTFAGGSVLYQTGYTCVLLLVDNQGTLSIRAARGTDSNLVRDFSGRMEEDVINQLKAALKIGDNETLVSVPIIAKQLVTWLLVIARDQPLNADEQWQLSAGEPRSLC